MDSIVTSKWFKAAKLFTQIYQFIFKSTVVVCCFCLLAFVGYLGYCLYDRRLAPVEFTLTSPESIHKGGLLTLCLTKAYRTQSYHFKREVSVTDNNSHRFDFDEIQGYFQVDKPSEYPDVCLDYQLPTRISEGPAKIRYTLIAERVNNMIDWKNPYVINIERTIQVLP